MGLSPHFLLEILWLSSYLKVSFCQDGMSLHRAFSSTQSGKTRAPDGKVCPSLPMTDMEFVQNFTTLDFQAKNFTPSISPNFNSFSKKKHKKWVKMEKFTPLAKILHCRRHWRDGQIPPLPADKINQQIVRLSFVNPEIDWEIVTIFIPISSNELPDPEWFALSCRIHSTNYLTLNRKHS